MRFLLLILFVCASTALLAQERMAICGLIKPDLPGSNVSKDTSVRIRFSCSRSILSTNQPLYIVDGKEVMQENIRSLDPNKIQSINILKAQRSCWGVDLKDMIIITTKCSSSTLASAL
jgi:hypothetical protein